MNRLAWLVVLALFSWSSPAVAHRVGQSEAEISLQEGGGARALLDLSVRELAVFVPVDSDGDGRTTQADIDTQLELLRGQIPRLLQLRTDGEPCASELVRADVEEGGDGVEVQVRYACAPYAGQLEAQVTMLASLSPSHRHTLKLEAGGRAQTSELGGPLREASLLTPFTRPVALGQTAAWVAGAGLILGLCALAWRQKPNAG